MPTESKKKDKKVKKKRPKRYIHCGIYPIERDFIIRFKLNARANIYIFLRKFKSSLMRFQYCLRILQNISEISRKSRKW